MLWMINPVFLNGTPVLADCRDDVEKFGDFRLILVVQENGFLLHVVRVDVSHLIDSLGKEAGPLQCDFTPCCLQDALQFQHDGVGHEADADMGPDPVNQPMVHRTDVRVRLAEAEGPVVTHRHDLYRSGSAFVMLSSDKHATKVATCRGTPKSMTKSASRIAVRLLFVKSPEK